MSRSTEDEERDERVRVVFTHVPYPPSDKDQPRRTDGILTDLLILFVLVGMLLLWALEC